MYQIPVALAVAIAKLAALISLTLIKSTGGLVLDRSSFAAPG